MSPGLILRSARHRRRLASAVLGLSLLVPAAASAADAPVRTIARDVAGGATTAFFPVAVSGDGREVIANLEFDMVVRDVEAGTTRKLVSARASAVSASTDLKVVLFSTEAGLVPSDTDGGPDLYVLDRATNGVTRVSDVPQAFTNGKPAQFGRLHEASLSGNGQVAQFRLALSGPNTDASGASIWSTEDSLWRLDRAAGGGPVKVREMPTPNQSSLTIAHTDAAGAVAITNEGATIAGRTVSLPTGDDPAQRSGTVAVSSDGRAVAVASSTDRATVKLVSTATGAVTSIPMPSWLVDAGYQLLNASTTGVLVSGRFTRAAGPRDAIGFVSTRGSVTQVGGDILIYPSTTRPVVSENLAFAANSLVLAQLGSRPLLGTEPPAATQPLSTWMTYQDVSCVDGPYTRTWTRASVTLPAERRGIDPRTPASATVKVYKTTSPSTVYNAFTMNAGTTRQLTVPQTGGWTYAATITFTDGTKASGTVDVAPHAVPQCSPFYWF
jgi:hypothetical protein